ncbi:MAG: cytidine deaminase [Salibacteraceae bacterium]
MSGKKFQIKTDFIKFSSWNDTPEDIQHLLKSAKHISTTAYAPFSSFFVGAAILLENGIVVTGSNQENAAYPSGLCAERVALFSAHSQFPEQRVVKLVIYANSEKHEIKGAISPCGACRQVISEYEFLGKEKIEIYMASDEEVIYAEGIESLLPMRFSLSN